MNGFVSLVGAGPGDPALLTRAAAARLRRADLVLYDALVEPRILALARRARRFFVGKRAGRHSIAQDAIARLMIRAARRGRRVVRLKGGDPFVFGRGGEEALALSAAGVPYEIVPGISSAVAAPALAGIPVTHRGTATGFVVVTGHDQATIDAALAALRPNTLTLVILMAVGQRAVVAERLAAAGWAAETPAAIVLSASRGSQATWRGTVAGLGQAVVDERAPGTIVVGGVAALDLRSVVPVGAVSGEGVQHVRRR